jgi:plastocyanin
MQRGDIEMHHPLRTLACGLGTCALIALVSGCGNNSTTPTGTTCNGSAAVSGLGTVAATIQATDNLVFVPASTSTSVGDVVEFKNVGTVAHTVTFQDANDGCLSDAMLNPGSTWEVKFTAAGTYNYLCTIHAPNMKGEITVTS